MSADIEITGLSSLEAVLKGLPTGAKNKVIRQALRAAAKDIQAKGKLNTPRESGTLAREIKVRAGKRSRLGISVVVMWSPTGADGKFHGSFPELGTAEQPAQGYAGKTFDESGKKAADDSIAAIWRGIKGIAKA